MRDPIERQAAIDEIQRFLGYIDQDMIDRIKIGLRKLPTIESVKHGHWNHDYDDIIISGTCSVCGWHSIVMETDVAGMPYCPNCGAKMSTEEGEIHD